MSTAGEQLLESVKMMIDEQQAKWQPATTRPIWEQFLPASAPEEDVKEAGEGAGFADWLLTTRDAVTKEAAKYKYLGLDGLQGDGNDPRNRKAWLERVRLEKEKEEAEEKKLQRYRDSKRWIP